jgi:mannose-1-phosphate guanylyltransferase
MLYAVIMAGGSGTRFWPKSRKESPKQLLKIVGSRTMMEDTARRFSGTLPPERLYVITNKEQAAATKRALTKVPRKNIIGEPMGRDTAAAIGLAAVILDRIDPEAVMAALPADHIIRPRRKFINAIRAAGDVAQDSESLITFGIVPRFAATGYGYIRRGKKLVRIRGLDVFSVRQFKEKPGRKTAERYVSSGRYYWNSGIFLWKVSVILAEMKKLLPGHFRALMKIRKALGTAGEKKVLEKEYRKLKRISIDYGVLEKARDVRVVAADFEWDDVGAWRSLEDHHEQDAGGNTILGKFVGVNTKDSIIVSDRKHLVAAIDMKDVIIVQTADATLVCPKASAQKVKELVTLLHEKGMDTYL